MGLSQITHKKSYYGQHKKKWTQKNQHLLLGLSTCKWNSKLLHLMTCKWNSKLGRVRQILAH